MLGGLIPPTAGSIAIDGLQLDRSTGGRLRGRMGFLTETPGLWDQLTVRDNLTVYARLFGFADPATAVERQLDRFDLWDRRDDKAALLSKGMKQKLALARALIHDPAIVLLDEPTANLDPQSARAVRDLLLDLKARGRAVVVSTHNLDEMERLADRIALINTRLVAMGEPGALRRDLFGRRLRIRLAPGGAAAGFVPVVERLGARHVRADASTLSMQLDDPDRDAPSIVGALVESGARVREVTDEQAPLEEVYMRLLGGAAS
jgi:ABC-2 type transport system ATP-binding protein